MRNAIFLLIFAGAAFGASAGGSWFLQTKMQNPDDQETSDSSPSAGASEGLSASDRGTNVSNNADLPVAVRPRPMSVEEVLRFGLGLNKREKFLNDRERSLNQEQSRLRLALADIHGEQQQIEGLQAKLQEQTDACQSVLSDIQQARQHFSTEREDAQVEIDKFEEVRIETSEQETQNIKKMSEWFQNMEPEDAAKAVKQFVDEGKTDLVIKLLANFEERDAAEILSALDDYPLMVELAERFKNYKRPPRKEARRR